MGCDFFGGDVGRGDGGVVWTGGLSGLDCDFCPIWGMGCDLCGATVGRGDGGVVWTRDCLNWTVIFGDLGDGL